MLRPQHLAKQTHVFVQQRCAVREGTWFGHTAPHFEPKAAAAACQQKFDQRADVQSKIMARRKGRIGEPDIGGEQRVVDELALSNFISSG